MQGTVGEEGAADGLSRAQAWQPAGDTLRSYVLVQTQASSPQLALMPRPLRPGFALHRTTQLAMDAASK